MMGGVSLLGQTMQHRDIMRDVLKGTDEEIRG